MVQVARTVSVYVLHETLHRKTIVRSVNGVGSAMPS